MAASHVDDAEVPLTDEELAELALAADPDVEIEEGAVPLRELIGAGGDGEGSGLLPEWYMPAAMGSRALLTGWRRRLVFLVIAAFVLINAYGLCSTYGHVGFG